LPTTGVSPLHDEIRAGKQYGPDPHDLPADIKVNIEDVNEQFYGPEMMARIALKEMLAKYSDVSKAPQ
jgi:hypothetical protein